MLLCALTTSDAHPVPLVKVGVEPDTLEKGNGEARTCRQARGASSIRTRPASAPPCPCPIERQAVDPLALDVLHLQPAVRRGLQQVARQHAVLVRADALAAVAKLQIQDWKVNGIDAAPFTQPRADRWQMLMDCARPFGVSRGSIQLLAVEHGLTSSMIGPSSVPSALLVHSPPHHRRRRPRPQADWRRQDEGRLLSIKFVHSIAALPAS